MSTLEGVPGNQLHLVEINMKYIKGSSQSQHKHITHWSTLSICHNQICRHSIFVSYVSITFTNAL